MFFQSYTSRDVRNVYLYNVCGNERIMSILRCISMFSLFPPGICEIYLREFVSEFQKKLFFL